MAWSVEVYALRRANCESRSNISNCFIDDQHASARRRELVAASGRAHGNDRAPTATELLLLAEQFFPLGVDHAGLRLIGTRICVRAEEVALCLCQIQRQLGRAIRVEVAD